MVQDAAVLRVAESEGAADVGVILAVRLALGAAGGEEVHAIDIPLPAQVRVRTVGVQDLRGLGAESVDHLPHHRRIAPELVAQGEQSKGGMASIGTDDVQAFLGQERDQFLPFQRPPERELRLEVDPELVRGGESGLRRAPGMEPDMIDAVILAALEVMDPGGFVHGRMPCQREHAGVVLAAEEDRMPAGPELTAHDLQPRHLRDRELLGNLLHRPELDAADDAVPVRLGVVRIEVGALDHLHRHAPAIVHA